MRGLHKMSEEQRKDSGSRNRKGKRNILKSKYRLCIQLSKQNITSS